MDETTITLPLAPQLFWGFVALAGIALASWLVFALLPGPARDAPFITFVRRQLGLTRLPTWIFVVAALLWTGLAIVLTAGLFYLIFDTLLHAVPNRNVPSDIWDFRFKLVQLTALTTVLGALIALPLTLARLRLTRWTNRTAEDSLFNEKINAATQGLYARRQKTLGEGKNTRDYWQDDIVQRNAAIDRLEGLAQERPDEVPRIARLLSVYVRELSAEVPPQEPPEDATPEALRNWAEALPKLRSDMEKAAQTLGRLEEIASEPLENREIDLRNANLQKAELRGVAWANAQLRGIHLQGADLTSADLLGTDLSDAHLQVSVLTEANLRRANLSGSQMTGAEAAHAIMTDAQLISTQMDQVGLIGVDLQNARLSFANLQHADLSAVQAQEADFTDADLAQSNLENAVFSRAYLNDACLRGTQLYGATFSGAGMDRVELQGTELAGIGFDDVASLAHAGLVGCAVRDVELTTRSPLLDHLNVIFGDGSVTLPNGLRPGHDDWPAHWGDDTLSVWEEFEETWHKWQATLPPGWDEAGTRLHRIAGAINKR